MGEKRERKRDLMRDILVTSTEKYFFQFLFTLSKATASFAFSILKAISHDVFSCLHIIHSLFFLFYIHLLPNTMERINLSFFIIFLWPFEKKERITRKGSECLTVYSNAFTVRPNMREKSSEKIL